MFLSPSFANPRYGGSPRIFPALHESHKRSCEFKFRMSKLCVSEGWWMGS